MEMFKSATGSRLFHVPYRGAGAALLDVQGGQVQVMFSALSVALGAIQEKKLNALAVASTSRSALLPNVPTVAEAGVPGFSFSTWTAMLVPKGTPAPVIERLNAEVAKALKDPAVSERLTALGATPQPGTPRELGELIQGTIVKMGKVVKDANIQAE
jgi:tripartite-type tricarboxylate transporter receptor subunit TctC